jgi:hypothetical protein
MRVAICFLLALTASSSFGQKIRFTYPGNRWVVGDANPGGSYQLGYGYYPSDSVLHGRIYKRFSQYNNFVREDTAAGYVYYFDFAADTERVLYNYNWQLGDTILYHLAGSTVADSVIGMDSILIDSTWHRLWTMQGIPYGAREYTIIEGIGATTRPIDIVPCFEAASRLSCFVKDSLYPTFTAPYRMCFHASGMFTNDSFCIPFYVRTPDLQLNPKVALFPNPASDVVHVLIKETTPSTNEVVIQAYDMLGSCIYAENVSRRTADHEIPVNNWPAGLYTVMIQGYGENNVVRKIAITR